MKKILFILLLISNLFVFGNTFISIIPAGQEQFTPDANIVVNAFRANGYNTFSVEVLDTANMFILLDNILKRVSPDEEKVIVYITGHGFIKNGDQYINLGGKIKISKISSFIKNKLETGIGTEVNEGPKLLFFIDTCRELTDLDYPKIPDYDIDYLFFSQIPGHTVTARGRFTSGFLAEAVWSHIKITEYLEYFNKRLRKRKFHFKIADAPHPVVYSSLPINCEITF